MARFHLSAVCLLGALAAGSVRVSAGEFPKFASPLIAIAAADVAADTHGSHDEQSAPATENAEAGKAEGESEEGAQSSGLELWPKNPVVELDQQPYMLVRKLRSVQDQVAAGSVSAHEQQRELMKDIGAQMVRLPIAVWDDVRNVRAAIFFVLSGGNPAVLRPVADRTNIPTVERRAIRGALAFGEGRQMDALGLLQRLEARKLDPQLGGIVALMQGTLIARRDPVKAIRFLDEARLLSPGTLIEEAALRQGILLLAREGDLERFDVLAGQYARRFPNSLFAQSFRRQFFAGVARQNFKRASEWISRTETELMKMPASERVGLYLAIAEEATKGGNVDIARYAAGKARELSHADSTSFQRATMLEGAAMAATEDYQKGIDLLNSIDPAKIDADDQSIRQSALRVGEAVGRWPAAPPKSDEPVPASVSRAEALLGEVDTLLGDSPR